VSEANASSSPTAWPPGDAVQPRVATIDREVIEAFRGLAVSAIGDVMGCCTGTVGLRQYHARLDTVLCGLVVTVRVRPGDNLMIHKAPQMVEPGDVLVIDGGGDVSQALVGGLMRTTCVTKGLAGLVIDGAVRDL